MNFFTEIKEGLSIAWDAIRANKLRSVLTTLGIIIGIVTVTSMATAIDALNRAFHDSITTMGADVLFASRMDWFNDSEDDWIKSMNRRDITLEQVKAVEKQMTLASAVAPVVDMSRSVRYKNRSASRVQIIGTTDQFLTTSGFNMDEGRFLTAGEAEAAVPSA